MTSDRRRLVVAKGALPSDPALVDALTSVFEVHEVESDADARREAGATGDALVLTPIASDALPADGLALVLDQIGEGVGIVDANGVVTWANQRLRAYPPDVQQRLVRTCHRAAGQFNEAAQMHVPLPERAGRRFTFNVDDAHYEALVAVATVDPVDGQVLSVVGMLWEITAARRLQRKIDAIDAAGSELMRIEASAIAKLNMSERLKVLESKILKTVRELLHFDHFEIRIVDRETNQLEPVFSVGLAPLEIGHVIFAEREDNGICGYVAATGESYMCRDVPRDARYTQGLPDARSTLTVPLRLHDRVIGVFNVESLEPNAFDEHDRRFAEIFGRYVALAMHIFDLLVVERYTTNEQIAENLLCELEEPLQAILDRASALGRGSDEPAVAVHVAGIGEAIEAIRRRLSAYTDGPRSLVGAELELETIEPDPRMVAKQVILADNEPTVRTAIARLLRRKGCEVTVCAGGTEVIQVLHQNHDEHRVPDLVISDIRMPDRNGYEVYRTTHELFPSTPVILITGFGYDPHHSIVRASQEGLHSFLFKPIKASVLLETVTDALVGAET